MSKEIVATAGTSVVLASKKDLERAIAHIAAVLPPKLSEDMPLKAWIKLMAETVGDHPPKVLAEARVIMLSTCQFAPTPKEFVDAVLLAYPRLKLALSEDAKRHLAYRKKTSTRYITGEDGKQRFVDDARLTTIAFVSVAGVHANMVMDRVPEATVTDVERALLATSEQMGKREGLSIGEILKALEAQTRAENAYRVFGRPEDFCGGEVAHHPASYRNGKYQSQYLALSVDFVRSLREAFPKACMTEGAITEAFSNAGFVAYKANPVGPPKGYGTTYQAEAEAHIWDRLRMQDFDACKEQAQRINASWRFYNHKGDEDGKATAESDAAELARYCKAKAYAIQVYEKPQENAA